MPDQANAGDHPPRPRLALRIGVTGHRPNKLRAVEAAVAAAVHTALGAIKAVGDFTITIGLMTDITADVTVQVVAEE